MNQETFEFWFAGLFFLTYTSLYCIWWYKAIVKGEFD